MSGRIYDAGDIQRFVIAGNAVFTIVSGRTGTRFTFRVRAVKGKKLDFDYTVEALTGPNNESDYTYLGEMQLNNRVLAYRHGAKSPIGLTAPTERAFEWFIGQLGDPTKLDRMSFYHEGRCGRCGRILTVPESIASGLGPECAKRA